MLNFEALYQQTKNLNLLFVEDYLPLREKIVEILEDFFHNVTQASNGEEGLQLYLEFEKEHNKTFDIVITDIRMPLRDGISLTKAIQKIDKDQIIIVLSAHQESDYLLELINLGIAQFIPKPIEPEKLLNVIQEVSKKIKRQKPESINTNTVILNQDLRWNKELRSLTYEGDNIELTKYEIIVMRLLIEKIEYVCSTDVIMQYFLYEEIELTHESIRNMMSRLRKKIPGDVISNIYALGYKISQQG
ncbi:MAG: response regulator transcription factor [Campylobacterota bacterium]|nr:response regulator transcription factor [Campylobacterota bacterium]